LWKIDVQGNVTSLDIRLGGNDSYPNSFQAFNGELYFAATDGRGEELWKITPDGIPVLVADTVVGPEGLSPKHLTVFQNELYMTGSMPASGRELWKLDTQGNIDQVADIYPGPKSAFNDTTGSILVPILQSFDHALFLSANDGVHGGELWSLDRQGQLELVADINPGPNSSGPTGFTEFNRVLYFSADGGVEQGGRELWRVLPEPAAHQNQSFPADVDDDGEAGVSDLLEIVHYLRSGGPVFLSGAPAAPPYLDVNGDRLATVADLVAAIAEIRSQIAAQAEGESEGAQRVLYFRWEGKDDFSDDNAFFVLDQDELLLTVSSSSISP
jgi:ELWxxDGT repeat protein